MSHNVRVMQVRGWKNAGAHHAVATSVSGLKLLRMQVHIMLRLWLFQVVNTLMGAFMFWDASRNSQVLSLLAFLVQKHKY